MKKKLLLGFAAILLSWTAWAVGEELAAADNPLTITWIDSMDDAIPYAGDDTNKEISFKVSFTLGGVTQDNLEVWKGDGTQQLGYTVTYKKGEEPIAFDQIRDAGDYTIEITGYGFATGQTATKTFTVTPKKLTYTRLTLVQASKTYGEDDQVVLAGLVQKNNNAALVSQLAKNNKATGESDPEFENFLKCLEVKRYGENQDSEEAGSYRVFVSAKSEEEAKTAGSNYVFADAEDGATTDNAQMTIKPLELTVSVKAETYKAAAYEAANDLMYTLKAGETEIDNQHPLPFGDKLTATLSYTGTSDKETLTNADTYELNVTLTANDDTAEEPAKQHTTNPKNYTLVAGQSSVEGTANFTITQAELKITAKSENAEDWNKGEFGEITKETSTDFSDNFNYTNIINPDTRDDLELAMKREAGEDAKSYAIMPYVGKDATTPISLDDNGENTSVLQNYKIVYAKENQVAYTITAKDITNDIDVKIDETLLTYQGKDFELPEGLVTSVTIGTDASDTPLAATDYTVELKGATPAPKNADDEVTIVVKPATTGSNYTFTAKEVTKQITKATLTIAARKGEDGKSLATKVYGSADPALMDVVDEEGNVTTEGVYEITGWAGNEGPATIGLSLMRHGGENVLGQSELINGYMVYPAKDGEAFANNEGAFTTTFDNYNIEYAITSEDNIFKITKKDLHYTIAATKEYDGTDALPQNITYNLTATDLVKSDDLNIDDSEATAATLFTIQPTVSLKQAEGEAEAATAKNAGKYILVAEGAVADNYNPIFSETADNYEITPRTVTITGPTLNKDFGVAFTEEEVAGLTGYAHTSIVNEEGSASNSGQLADDRRALRAIMKLTVEDEKAWNGESGKYDIVVGFVETTSELAEAKKTELEGYGYTGETAVETLLANYGYGVEEPETFSVTHGTLNIGVVGGITLNGSNVDDPDAEEPETDQTKWSVAKTIEEYNGATVETVTVKNLKSLKNAGFTAEAKWYTLVLPFDVTVREISNALGYAIVNVPTTTNTNPDEVVFHLTMGTIPANTMMAFKVDNTLNSDEEDGININEKGITFTNKTIVAPAEDYEWIHDNAGNHFIGVYAEKVINGDNQYYLNPTYADFRPASKQKDATLEGGYGMVINALNGYVEFSENADLNKVRILLEEADGSVTAISTVNADKINSAEGWYSVDGMKLNSAPTQKGIYINNGKKVVIK